MSTDLMTGIFEADVRLTLAQVIPVNRLFDYSRIGK